MQTNHLCLIGKDIYESHMLRGRMFFLSHERDIPLGYEGMVGHVMRRKRWICKACLEALLCRQLKSCSAREVGVRVFLVREECACCSTPVSPGCMWASQERFQAPAPTGEPQPLSHGWGTSCWGCAAPWIAWACCRGLGHPRSCFELSPLQGALEEDHQSATQHGSEKQALGV